MELTGRQSTILYAVIHEYVTSRVPVSSKRILEITNLECSSATIRSEMKTLEGLGSSSSRTLLPGACPRTRAYGSTSNA